MQIGQINVILAFKGPSIVCQSATYDSFCQIGSHIYIFTEQQFMIILTKIIMAQSKIATNIQNGRQRTTHKQNSDQCHNENNLTNCLKFKMAAKES